MGDRDAIPALEELLKRGGPEDRVAAEGALVKLGAKVQRAVSGEVERTALAAGGLPGNGQLDEFRMMPEQKTGEVRRLLRATDEQLATVVHARLPHQTRDRRDDPAEQAAYANG